LRWELAVRRAYEAAGFTVRGLEGEGDHLCFGRNGLVIGSEAKNQQRLKVPEWWRQTTTDAPDGAVPVLTMKLPGGEMVSMVRTSQLLELLSAQATGGTEESGLG
jgi:hypothetical protein